MARLALLIFALSACGCIVSFGELPDGGSADAQPPGCDCRIDGGCQLARATSPEDLCLECRPERSSSSWTDVCGGAIVETSFADFADGTMPRSLGNLYVSADGAVRVVRTADVNVDGFPDLVVTNHVTDGPAFAIPSQVYFGSAAGLDPSSPVGLPTLGAEGSAIADLNADGWPDLVFANHYDGGTRSTYSYIYWGSRAGFSTSALHALPTVGAAACSVADLNADGWLDLVFANQTDGVRFALPSYVYWGSPSGFSAANHAELATVGASGAAIADLNRDGMLDLVFSNHFDGASRLIDSFVYWGTAAGFSDAARTTLPGIGTGDLTIVDWDGDDHLDVILPSYFDGATYAVPTYVYLGGDDGFDPARRAEVPSVGAWGVTVSDLDADGALDLVLASYTDDGANVRVDSHAYLDAPSGGTVVRLPTVGALGATVADFDRDGYPEAVLSSFYDGARYTGSSLVFRGTDRGPSTTSITPLATTGAHVGTSADLGNLYDRSDAEEYISSPIELPRGAVATRLSFSADTPAGSSVRLAVRSAPTPAELDAAPWRGPSEDEPFFERFSSRLDLPADHRVVQYRAVFRTPFFAGLPVLDSVSIAYLEE